MEDAQMKRSEMAEQGGAGVPGGQPNGKLQSHFRS